MSNILEVASQTEQYVATVEHWNGDRQAAMVCKQVEETVELGTRIFDEIVAFDESWRRKVLRGELQFSPVIHSLILALFRRWYVPASDVLAAIESLRNHGLSVNGAEDFRQRCRETEGGLTPDADFFAAGELVDLRDEALDQHFRAETLEHGPG